MKRSKVGRCGRVVFAALVAFLCGAEAATIRLNGYLDSDVWTDFRGNLYTNDELDLATTVAFGDSGLVKAHLNATVKGGNIPAGLGEPGQRWVAVLFDGVDIEFESPVGRFTVGDLVYQYGTFNYYLYKRRSMIVDESFARGIKYSYSGTRVRQEILFGAADVPDEIVRYQFALQRSNPGDTLDVVTVDSLVSAKNAFDVSGTTTYHFSEGTSVSLFYGGRADIAAAVQQSASAYIGAEITADIGKGLKLKGDLGYRSIPIPDSPRVSLFTLLLEPTYTVKKFSLACSYFQVIDPQESGASPVGEDMFAYVEPGISLSSRLAVGLPLEVHSNGATDQIRDNGTFGIVPTVYIYPWEGVQWWLWGQAVLPFAAGRIGYGLGSELIVKF